MTPTPEHLEAFAPLEWATPYLTSPDWLVSERHRGNDPIADKFNRETIRANDGIQHWLELHPITKPGETATKTISLIQYGIGLSGLPGTCHGGALLTMVDEALAYVLVANEIGARRSHFDEFGTGQWKGLMQQGKPPSEALEGFYVTASLDTKFLKVALCPGVVGIETELLEMKGRKMKIRATMKDAKGAPIMQSTALWVKLSGAAKL